MNPQVTFQASVLKLHQFWQKQGCVLWHPYYAQVGAGTMNPATFLRVLGPEPWRVGYVEPSIRPDDARFGENPNRMQQHYQYQVILKPEPGNPQELYIQSLIELGIDPNQHDIRFVEDNWETPLLGAWGLGWEVWLDGQEITQFTYFQQAGGQVLDPVSVEITYGLERILMALQGVGHFADLHWAEGLTYGDLNLMAEREHSGYYFNFADVEHLWTLYQEYKDGARTSLEGGLVLPAYDYLLKCSHTFNVLDTRGAIGVTERASMFGEMRGLAREVSEAYLAQREELGHPFFKRFPLQGEKPKDALARATEPPDLPQDFLLEVGTEELPARDVETALEFLQKTFSTDLLDGLNIGHQEVRVHGTPRRLVVHVSGLEPQQRSYSEQVKGPPERAAFDESGQPTQALLGWARKYDIPEREIGKSLVQEVEGGRYVTYTRQVGGANTAQLLADSLPAYLSQLTFDQSMRWNDSGVEFSRPIRWIVALHGGHVIPFRFAGLKSGEETRGMRFGSPETLRCSSPEDYFQYLEDQGVVLSVESRRELIREQLEALAREVRGHVPEDPELLLEVTQLVEKPTALLGSFKVEHLELPSEVIVSVMKKHQRYFPVVDDEGDLMPYFLTVRNGGEDHLDTVRLGNEHVIEARFEDAAYFIQQDLKVTLSEHREELERLVFQTELGSMLDKVERVEALVASLAKEFGISLEDRRIAVRAAHLSKADLVTKMVVEMTSLQGVMGREYAKRTGEEPEVAQAIFEHYLPRWSGDLLPKSMPGIVVGLADRLDTLMGLFAVGLQPSGTSDPFALRRTAIGLIQVLQDRDIRFDLRHGLGLARSQLPVRSSQEDLNKVMDFLLSRQEGILSAKYPYDVVRAVLAEQSHDPAGAAKAADELERWVADEGWETVLQAFARCARITRDLKETFPVDPEALHEPEERQLYEALITAQEAGIAAGSVKDFLEAFSPMVPAITAFFDEVLVMTEDQLLRENRLGMLQEIVGLSEGIVDLSEMEGF